MSFYENPDCLPLEELQLNIKNDGVIVVINALDAKWVDKRYFLLYEEPEIYNEDGSEIVGAKEHWLECVSYIIEDLNWLLNLPFYRFWSNIVYNTSIMAMLISFLQEAPPFYALENFPTEPKMLEALENLRRNVLIVFVRLCTNKQSSTEYMKRSFLGNLLYNHYIFTIPIIFDLCQLYGRENDKIVEKIVHSVFSLQPMYNDDLQKSVPCLIKALQNVERRFEDCPSNATEAVALSERGGGTAEMTLYNLEDLILYILDVSSTLTVLLKTYPPVIATFHKEDFINKIVSLYGNTIPEMYKILDRLAFNEESMPKYIELKHRLDVTRVDILNLHRMITYEPILNIQEKINTITEDEIRDCIDEYLNLLMNAISEKEFIIDYHKFYPINVDLEIMTKLSPEVFDAMKHEYILQSLHASIGKTSTKATSATSLNNTNIAVAGSSGVQTSQQKKHSNDVYCINDKMDSGAKECNIMSLISEVREILCDCGEGFIQLCLKHYNYNVESVVNAVLEDSLPHNLKKLDRTIPYIPPDPVETPAFTDFAAANLASNFQELTVSRNDDFEVTTEDFADALNIRKRKDKYRNANEMLNDKSDIKKAWNIYEKYSLIADEYDDEYDDTYDSHDIGSSAPDDSTEADGKSFTIPRILKTYNKNNASSEDETEIENKKSIQNSNHFVQDPAELRAKAEQRKQYAREDNNADGKGFQKQQDKSGSVNRKKTVYNSTQRNHNRRVGAQIKRRHGMVPS
ncbi:activating signal cointegrator 1 complex subunit 2 [Monomorium pharaonis]|uniref:activating signal cointegrator 1 complex subunit 2 n=1 Tax=Monomorium pharaonis TaxID=307658 RepID=UPI00063F0A52|nr:activating signal cointegrator 1 complex subunit 2 [Monomorium pharaonis]XP_036144870.1 activating signal cointegrator 1 complex subunit 2 [Monomorium pharaonis]